MNEGKVLRLVCTGWLKALSPEQATLKSQGGGCLSPLAPHNSSKNDLLKQCPQAHSPVSSIRAGKSLTLWNGELPAANSPSSAQDTQAPSDCCVLGLVIREALM